MNRCLVEGSSAMAKCFASCVYLSRWTFCAALWVEQGFTLLDESKKETPPRHQAGRGAVETILLACIRRCIWRPALPFGPFVSQ